MIRGFLKGLGILALIAAVVLWRVLPHAPHGAGGPGPPSEGCSPAGWDQAARANAGSLESLAWAPFGPPEIGWATYAPLVMHEIGTRCPVDSPGFAAALARWEQARKLPGTGVFGASDFKPMLVAMELRRPFVQLTARNICPAPPSDLALAAATPEEGYGRKVVQLRASALAAYRRLANAARAAGVASDADDFKLISGFRGPAEEAARCVQGGCNTRTRAHCSAHRTGLAMDLYLGHATGEDPTSTSDANRRAVSRTRAYRWLVQNGDRFGFLPYPYEPWHWEWTGEPP